MLRIPNNFSAGKRFDRKHINFLSFEKSMKKEQLMVSVNKSKRSLKILKPFLFELQNVSNVEITIAIIKFIICKAGFDANLNMNHYKT
ncbi:hypothetical protein BpHYR1_015040 [Brachionus plicatilis]|uniref:Uncharacterized protein n=1 Tax=Brachionus plicatilis TaxID=10195 RepID=A0A3M7QIW0_BRAPC|nr:hypothetical protein BpHYR1_015040 [Brachionus plicatilis]